MDSGAITRRVALLMLAAAGSQALAQAVAPASVPAVLNEPAVMSAKAPGAATLAVTRAGPRLVAVGERGTVLLSDDDGASWRQAKVPVQATLTSVRFVDDKLGWAAGHLGVILHSRDGGETWAKQLDGVQAAALIAKAAPTSDERAQRDAQRFAEEGPDKPFFDIAFVDSQRGFAVGAYNLAFETADGGKSWTPLVLRLPNPRSLHLYALALSGGQVFIAGEQGLLLQSTDGGARFTALASPYKGSFFGLVASRTGTLIAYGLRGNTFRSSDQGQHWDKVDTQVHASLTAGLQRPDGALLLVSQIGELLVSRDDGLSFKKQPSAEPVPASGLAVANNGQLVLASLRGMRRQPAP